MQALAMSTESTMAHLRELQSGVTNALTKRDAKLGDYRKSEGG